MNLWDLKFWQSGEWQVINERLQNLEEDGVVVNPPRGMLFNPLRASTPGEVKVAIIGQDPYPARALNTGYAFSIPRDIPARAFPPTLGSIFREYTRDLRYPVPSHGDLSKWTSQGVLLWNAIPTCEVGRSLSHDWPGEEWDYLTKEIIETLSAKGIVFALLGSVARRHFNSIDQTRNEVITTSHPSPRGSRSKTPFEGSRLFSTINDKLVKQGLTPIDWKLDDIPPARKNAPDLPPVRPGHSPDNGGTDLAGKASRVLPNLTGVSLGPVRDARGNVISM